ncbi:MAG: DUF2281 domain-containing protein [Ginsengibacter sp.]
MDNILLYSKLAALPENMKSEVLAFIDSLLLDKTKKEPSPKKPKFGSGKGMFKMNKNFDQPLEDFKEYM